MKCKFCGKLCKNNNSLRNHERLCKNNPNRQKSYFEDKKNMQKVIASRKSSGNINQWSNPDYTISDSTRNKLSKSMKDKKLTDEHKAKISKTVNEKVKNNEWHTSLAKNMHYEYKGIDLHGTWELKYAKWLDENDIKWQRCAETFKYVYNDKERRYKPDFYLIETKEYVEIKGYTTDKDVAKWEQFPKSKNLVVLKEGDLSELKIL